MSGDNHPLVSVGAGVTLALALGAIVLSVVSQPPGVSLSGKFQYVFAALFLGLSIGHYLGDSLVSEGEEKKYALVGLFSTLGVLFVAFLAYGQGVSVFTGGIGGTLIFFAMSLILSHHTGIIADSERLDQLVGEFAGKVSPGGLAFILVAFVAEYALNPEVAATISQIVIVVVGFLIAFYVLKYREPILAEIEPLIRELSGSDDSP